LASCVVGIQDGRDDRGCWAAEVGRIALPVWLDAEYRVVEAGVGPDGGVQFVRGVDNFGVPNPAGGVNPPELDPSPARGGDYAGRLGSREVTAQQSLVGTDDLGGEVPRKPEDEVTRFFHRFGPAAPEDDGGVRTRALRARWAA
jgi:hypothetical protein